MGSRDYNRVQAPKVPQPGCSSCLSFWASSGLQAWRATYPGTEMGRAVEGREEVDRGLSFHISFSIWKIGDAPSTALVWKIKESRQKL